MLTHTGPIAILLCGGNLMDQSSIIVRHFGCIFARWIEVKWEGRPFFSLLFQREQYVACTVLLLDLLELLEPGISIWRAAC